ncbi:hypothetical protein IQ22_01652 [Pseudomonas duriflava]|uniref:Uncharacterized protein n=1 Tax=Pseudomonas duriflava TaxID=459528 RepID=A0A562QG72_9PSED|nr:hypothetical protein IQ22_01652 [Pseudomonas duriflava]
MKRDGQHDVSCSDSEFARHQTAGLAGRREIVGAHRRAVVRLFDGIGPGGKLEALARQGTLGGEDYSVEKSRVAVLDTA